MVMSLGCGYGHDYEFLSSVERKDLKLRGYNVGWALYIDLNGHMDHVHDYNILRKHDQENLDHCDVYPK